MKYGVDLNMDQNAIQNAVIQPLTSAPASGVAGQIYFNSTDKKLYQYDGTVWKQVGIASAFSAGEVTANSIPLTLAESDGTTSTVTIVGAGGATLSKSGSTITITTSDNDTTYDAGTFQELQDGTVTTVKVWSPSILAQYVSGLNALAWEHADTALAAAQAAQADADDAAAAAASAQTDATAASTAASTAIQSANDAVSSSTAASQSAATALANSIAAVNSADTASQAAQLAMASATSAQDSAGIASENAAIAKESAKEAQIGLSNIEDVVGTVEWIRQHAVYALTEDTEVSDDKWYYEVVGTVVADPSAFELKSKRYYTKDNNDIYHVVEASVIDPQETYYELTASVADTDNIEIFELTEDIAIDPDKTYFTRSGAGTTEDPYVYTVVEEPDVADISTYYEVFYSPLKAKLYEIISYDESIKNYIDNYLALDAGGLHLRNGSNGRVDISTTDGVVMYNSDGKKVATYGANTVIGDANGYHIKIVPGDAQQGIASRLSFYAGDESQAGTEVAYMTDDKLWIPNVVVVKSMQAGNWMWDSGADKYHLTLRWIEGGE